MFRTYSWARVHAANAYEYSCGGDSAEVGARLAAVRRNGDITQMNNRCDTKRRSTTTQNDLRRNSAAGRFTLHAHNFVFLELKCVLTLRLGKVGSGGQLTRIKYAAKVKNCVRCLCRTGVKVMAMTTCPTLIHLRPCTCLHSQRDKDNMTCGELRDGVKINVSCYMTKLDVSDLTPSLFENGSLSPGCMFFSTVCGVYVYYTLL